MTSLHIDIETYSEVDLKKSGLYKYVQHPSFEILLFSVAAPGEMVRTFDFIAGEQHSPAFQDVIRALNDPQYIKKAQNAAFEWYCLSKFYATSLDQWECTKVHGLYCGLPASLAGVGEAMSLPQDKRKMGIGASLIRTFCLPCKPTKTNGNRTRTLPHHEPEKWALFKEYNRQDVVAEMDISRMLSAFPIPASENELWRIDQRINNAGVAVDLDLIKRVIDIDTETTQALFNEAIALTQKDNPKSVKQLTEWLEQETDVEVSDLKKETVKTLLAGELQNDTVRRVLEIRQQLSKTSTKKYVAMQTCVCGDSRVRGLLEFYGANRTGRWAGRLVQVQNLPKNHSPLLDFARNSVKKSRKDLLDLTFDSVPDILSQLIRTAFVAPEGKLLYVADFSAIEARVIAWLADEKWRQEVFATHGKIYEASASQMFGVPLERITRGNPEYDLRSKGKVAELALGYQGASGALITMGALKQGLTEEELPEIVSRWRSANPRIVDMWYAVENAAFAAMRYGQSGTVKGMLFQLETGNGLHFLTCQLPSGRKLYYAQPFIRKNEKNRDALYYYGIDQTTKKWGVQTTYGGKLVENITQAIARDCLAESIKRLAQQNWSIVMHIHDEIVIEAPCGDYPEHSGIALNTICAEMGKPISWAPGLLLKAEGFTGKYYKKE